jgi:ribosomal protein L37AE/L43A
MSGKRYRFTTQKLEPKRAPERQVKPHLCELCSGTLVYLCVGTWQCSECYSIQGPPDPGALARNVQ